MLGEGRDGAPGITRSILTSAFQVKMARPEGFEPPTNRIGTCYSIQLSYGRVELLNCIVLSIIGIDSLNRLSDSTPLRALTAVQILATICRTPDQQDLKLLLYLAGRRSGELRALYLEA